MSDEGEIIARLKLDASDYRRGIDEAKADAESLKSVDPNIHVTADTAGAVAGLNAVAASTDKVAIAEERLRTATQASDRATASALLAQMRLDEVQNKRGRSAYQVASAEEALRVATERSDNAAIKAIAAEDQLAAARRDAAKAALEEGAASDVAGEKASNAAKGPVPWMGILAGSIAAVSPGIVAVGAAAIGLSGELTGLGVTGVLAFKGIQAGIAAGLPAFAGVDDALSGLHDQLIGLELVAGGGVMSGLSASIRTVQGDIGPITADVALLSHQLGGLLASSVDTTVHAMAGFTPVLVAGGAALQGFLHGVDGFTQSNGFTAFVDYTVARLPDVMHLLDAALGAIGGLFSALAPAGQSTLFMLSSLMDLIRALAPTVGALMPTVIGLSDAIGGIALVIGSVLNALGPFGPAAILTGAALFGLSAAAKGLAPALLAAADAEGVTAAATRGLGAAIDFATGPLGIVLLAAGALASALATIPQSAEAAASSVADLTSALQQDGGAVGQATKQLTANTLMSDGAAAAGGRLGLSLKTLTAAATGNTTALRQVNTVVAQHAPVIDNATQAHSRFHHGLTQTQQDARAVQAAVLSQNMALKQATDAYNKVATASGQAKVSQQQMAAAAAAVHMPVAEFAAAAAAQQKAADTADQTRNKYILLGDAANLLKLDMDALNGVSISNAEAQAAWASGLDSLASSFNKANKAITGNSNAAVENRGAVASLAASGETALQSFAGLSHSASETTAKFRSMRGQLIQQVVDMGNSRAAATALVDQFFKIPKNIKTDFLGNDADAKAKAAAAQKAAEAFARGDYTAAYKADASPANKARADAMAKAEEFARKQYLAILKANPQPANASTDDAARKAHAFAAGTYRAAITATSAQAVAAARAAQAAINAVHSRQVTISAIFTSTGSAQIAKQYAQLGGRADGGTIGMAAGGTAGWSGTVTGQGNAWNDMAMNVRLANGEEVTSNMRGQADAFRGVLKAINSQKVKTPAQLGQMLGGGRQGPQTVVHRNMTNNINVINPVAVDPVQQTAEAAQLALAYAGLG